MTKPKAPRDAAIYIRLTQAELDWLDATAERWPFLSRSALARAAMVAGLDRIDAEGLEALAPELPKAKKKRAR